MRLTCRTARVSSSICAPTGLLRAVAHSPDPHGQARAVSRSTLADAPRRSRRSTRRFRADAIEAPAGHPGVRPREDGREPARRRGARRAPLSDDRLPRAAMRGRSTAGTLSGDLQRARRRRGASSMRDPRRRARRGVLVATGAWEGRLTNLGITPLQGAARARSSSRTGSPSASKRACGRRPPAPRPSPPVAP